MADSQVIAHVESSNRLPAVQERQSDNFLAMILQAASDPNIDAAKVETMANLAVRLQDRERETQFAQDFAAALMEMPRISKRGRIIIPNKDGGGSREQGRYAKFEDLDKVTRPILARHNMVISFRLGSEGPMTTATPILTHTNGYREVGDALKVPLENSGSKNNVQGVGSSSSYAKRYAMCAALNLITEGEDDDGSGYPLADDPLNDRQQRLVAEAEASSANGDYQIWYGRQTAKDKAWLVTTGVHARVGGGKTLPGPTTTEDRPEPEPEPEVKPETRKRLSPAEWVAGFKRDLDQFTELDGLDEYADAARAALDKLKEKDTALYDEANEAVRARRAALQDGRLV